MNHKHSFAPDKQPTRQSDNAVYRAKPKQVKIKKMKNKLERSFNMLSGTYTPEEAIDLFTKIVFIQIKLHEGKMHSFANGEDIATHRRHIDNLQKDLYAIRQLIEKCPNDVHLNSEFIIRKITPHDA